jgi:hypothetical protein
MDYICDAFLKTMNLVKNLSTKKLTFFSRPINVVCEKINKRDDTHFSTWVTKNFFLLRYWCRGFLTSNL